MFYDERLTEEEREKSWAIRLAKLKQCQWYWGDLSWSNAERLLFFCKEATFVIRDSRNDKYLFAVSYKHEDRVYHSRIEMSFLERYGPLSYRTVVENLGDTTQMIENGSLHMLMHRRGEEGSAIEINLTAPLTRTAVLPRLQYLCRLQIRLLVEPSRLAELPVSPPLLSYLSDNKYIVPNIEEAIYTLVKRSKRGKRLL